ncbi:MAG TPA: AraC family transcriptional regulator [Oxalicibacterium sp.]|uniref:AraC family transcriptional regulator n=1 Tax=Oxalicibacterium sp. TaxID=2766525 RepID=UPI002BA330A7|nr:AraC family transcriptional regulator [Oxalicibacterium sp.]HWU97735.1 AraC family transcriptional regulator [Oxalicibacterium sp.]
MSPPIDWLSRLLDMVPVSGHLEIHCFYGAPWRIGYEPSPPGELPYHVIVAGNATLEVPGEPTRQLQAGDILILPHGSPHALHDGSDVMPGPATKRPGLNLTITENNGGGEKLDMLCGRFIVERPHDKLLREYLPPLLVVRAAADDSASTTATQLAGLVTLMRTEADHESIGGHAMLNALSAAMFALALRLAGESGDAPSGLLSLAGNPRLAPALSALFHEPARPWTLPDLAELCNMSRATFARHFQDSMGRSASDLLTDIRMTLAANALKAPGSSVYAVSEAVGYQSETAFQRIFKQRMGMTPARWRRGGHASIPEAD